MSLFSSLLLLSALPQGLAAAPATLRLGGLFSQFDGSEPHAAGLQYQAAFLLAVQHLNNKTDGIMDDILPDTEIKIAVRHADSKRDAVTAVTSLIDTTIDGQPVGAIINGLPKENSDLEFEVAGYNDVFMMRAASDIPERPTSTSLSMFPGLKFEAFALQFLYCGNGFNRVSVIMEGGDVHQEAYDTLFNGFLCDMTVVSTTVVGDSTLEQMQDNLRSLRYARVNIFVVLMTDPEITATMVMAAHSLGLFRIGKQPVFTSYFINSDYWNVGFPSGTDVVANLRGFHSMDYRPDSLLLEGSEGVEFLSQWSRQAGTDSNGGGGCHAAVDDSAEAVFLHSDAAGTTCAGLDFSSVTSVKAIDKLVPLVYDAVMAYAVGMHYATIELDGSVPTTPADYKVALAGGLGWRPYSGLSGSVMFLPTEGNRLGGGFFTVNTFQPTVYAVDKPHAFGAIFRITTDNFGFAFCNPITFTGCFFPPQTNVANGGYPSNFGPYSTEPFPDVIRLGVFVNLFDGDGNLDSAQVQYLSAIMLAVSEINNKADGVADDVLPNSKVVVTLQQPSGFIGAELSVSASLNEAFTAAGVVGSISALSGAQTITMATKYKNLKVPVASFVATSAELGFGADYPYVLQTNPISTFQALAFQHMFCDFFQYKLFSIFEGVGAFGIKASAEIAGGGFCGLSPLSRHSISSNGANIERDVADAKAVGARVFVFLMGAGYERAAARLIEEGVAEGLFGENTQIFLPEHFITDKFWRYFSHGANVPELMKGFLALQYDGLEMLQRTESGMAFYERWRAQPATQWVSGGEVQCSQARDDDDQVFLYRSEGESNIEGYTCAGLNFSAFADDASDVTPLLGHAYDATNVLLRGIHAAILDSGGNFTGDTLMSSIIDTVEFDGASGRVDIFEGMSELSDYARGSRQSGHIYNLLNFDAALYAQNGPDGAIFRTVGRWTAEDGVEVLDDITYRSSHGGMVPQRLPDIIQEENFELKRAVLIVVACLCIFFSFFYTGMYVKNWKSKFVTSSQPRMSMLILLGGIFVGGRVLNAAFKITTATCITGLWLGHLGFSLVFCALFIKMWRVSSLINAGMKKIKISEWYVVQLTLGAVFAMMVYLCVLTWVGKPAAGHECTVESNRRTCDMICTFEVVELHTALFCIEALMVCYGAYLCYRIKGAPAAVNDSKYNAQAILVMAIIAAVGFVIVFLVDMSASIRQLVASCCIGMGFVIASYLLFHHILLKILGLEKAEKTGGSRNASSNNSKAERSGLASINEQSVNESSVSGTGEVSASPVSSINLSSMMSMLFGAGKKNPRVYGESSVSRSVGSAAEPSTSACAKAEDAPDLDVAKSREDAVEML